MVQLAGELYVKAVAVLEDEAGLYSSGGLQESDEFILNLSTVVVLACSLPHICTLPLQENTTSNSTQSLHPVTI